MTSLLFEDAIFDRLARSRSRTARSSESFQDIISHEMLNFTQLLARDRSTRIRSHERGYRVDFSNRIALDFIDLLTADNPAVNLEFTQDLLNYQPNADLIKKSKVPLWVIKQVGPQSVTIQRMW